jgi:hypothetical protein
VPPTARTSSSLRHSTWSDPMNGEGGIIRQWSCPRTGHDSNIPGTCKYPTEIFREERSSSRLLDAVSPTAWIGPKAEGSLHPNYGSKSLHSQSASLRRCFLLVRFQSGCLSAQSTLRILTTSIHVTSLPWTILYRMRIGAALMDPQNVDGRSSRVMRSGRTLCES